jgi:hypothetical protein
LNSLPITLIVGSGAELKMLLFPRFYYINLSRIEF